MNKPRVIGLSGGVGGARLSLGLNRLLAPEELMLVVNTGDDFTHLGLHVSPDIDTLLYTLSGRSNAVTGWGRADETWSFMSALTEIGGPGWFLLGDRGLAVHVWRTMRLHEGATCSEVTAELASRCEIPALIMPMTDDRVRTRVLSDVGWLDFQRYFVEHRCRPKIYEFEYQGAAEAGPAPGLIDAMYAAEVDAICICPSNPYLSIDPMLAIPAIRSALEKAAAPVIAVSPIIAGQSLKGPTGKIMQELKRPCCSMSVADHYRGLIDAVVIDERDRSELPALENSGIRVCVANTEMRTADDRIRLAERVLRFAGTIHKDRRTYAGTRAG